MSYNLQKHNYLARMRNRIRERSFSDSELFSLPYKNNCPLYLLLFVLLVFIIISDWLIILSDQDIFQRATIATIQNWWSKNVNLKQNRFNLQRIHETCIFYLHLFKQGNLLYFHFPIQIQQLIFQINTLFTY